MNYKTSKIALAIFLFTFLVLFNFSVKAQQYSSGTSEAANFTSIPMTLYANSASSSMQYQFDSGYPNKYSLPANSNHVVFDVQTPIRTTASISYSYRDQVTNSYGCDFQYILTYSGTSGSSDFYTNNFYATSVSSASGKSVTCAAQASSSQNVAVGSGGAGMYSGFKIKP